MFKIIALIIIICCGIFLYKRAQKKRLEEQVEEEYLDAQKNEIKQTESTLPAPDITAAAVFTPKGTREKRGEIDLKQPDLISRIIPEEPAINKQSEETAINKQSEEPAINEQTEKPAINEQSEEPAINKQTEEPAINKQAEKPAINEQTEEPAINEQTEEPAINDEKQQRLEISNYSWGNVTLKRAIDNYQHASDELCQHDALLSIISECYKQRKNKKYLKFGNRFITTYSSLFPHYRDKTQQQDPDAQITGIGLMQLSTLSANVGNYDQAIELCDMALKYDLHDNTVTGFEGRKKRITKARDKALKLK